MADAMRARLSADMRTALKAGDKLRLSVVRLLIADIEARKLEKGVAELGEDEELEVLRKACKNRREAIEQASAVGRQDVADREQAEYDVISSYLPAGFGSAELAAKVAELAAEIGFGGPADTGRFMKEWMARYKGRAEGRDVQAALRALRPPD